MSCCRPESIGPGPPGNRIQNNDLPYGREIYSDCVLPPCFVLRRLLPSLSRLLHVYIFSLCVSSLFICLSSVLYSYTCRSSFRAIPSTLFFFTLKGCFGWWVRREAGHHLAGRRRVEISEYNLEDEFWTLVTDISCWEKKLHRPQTIWDNNPAGRERIWGGKHEHDAQKHLHHRINIRKVSEGQTTPSKTYCLISGHSYDYQGVSNRAWKYININITL